MKKDSHEQNNSPKKAFAELTDEEVLEKFLAGDEAAFEHILDRYTPLIKKTIRSYYISGFDHEDMMQEARIVFYKALRKYKPKENYTLGTYYRLLLNNHYASLVRKSQTQKRRIHQMATSIDLIEERGYGNDYASLVAESPSVLENMVVEETVQELIRSFSPLEKEVLLAFIEYNSFEDIKANLGYPARKITNTIYRVKKRIIASLKLDLIDEEGKK